MDTKNKNMVSIIIPIYNERDIIDRLIKNLDSFKDSCEIIFVDGGSTDGTDDRIKGNYNLIHSPKKGRANQMNYGASISKGDILLFLHADSFMSIESISEIRKSISNGNRVGCFKLSFRSKSRFMKICASLSNLRVKLRNIAFGDQGIFIEKNYFYKLGAFLDIPIMEDYQLSMDIKQDGEKIVLLKTKIETSDRRFIKNGKLKTVLRMQRLQYMYRKGENIDKIYNLYK